MAHSHSGTKVTIFVRLGGSNWLPLRANPNPRAIVCSRDLRGGGVVEWVVPLPVSSLPRLLGMPRKVLLMGRDTCQKGPLL